MTKTERAFAALFVLLPVTVAAIYVLNPLDTATRDPRGRIFGHVPYRIPSESMAPTLLPGDQIVTKTYVYARNEPKRHEVIVFEHPGEAAPAFIFRIAGVSGDRIAIRDNTLFVNGAAIKEPYTMWDSRAPKSFRNFAEVVVPENHYFVLGDNRGNSFDSRFWGYLPRRNIIGRAHYIWSANDPAHIGPIKHGPD